MIFQGVTRDRHYVDALWNEHSFTLVDTGGFLLSDDDYFARGNKGACGGCH